MFATAFAPQVSLRDSSRVPAISRAAGISVAELICLLLCGALATMAIGLLHLSIQVPGHAIVRGGLPMAMGLALVPRRWAGVIMSIGAGATSLVMHAAQIGTFPSTAILSVLALGPVMDIALIGQSKGWRLYARLVVASAATNMFALALKILGVRLSIEMGGGGQFMGFSWPTLVASYFACGALAGLIGAATWFRAELPNDLRRN